MKPIAIINSDFDEYLSIRYEFTNVCNYSCNYCWPANHVGTSRWPDYEIVKQNFNHLITLYRTHFNKKSISIELTGGEPTLWPKLGEFVKYLHEEHGCRISLDTNGSRTIRWWEEYAEYFNDIAISVHHEFCNLEHIKNVLNLVYSKGTVMVSASVLMDPLNWDKSKVLVDELVIHPIPWLVKVTTLVETQGDKLGTIKEYTDDQLVYLKDKIKKIPPDEFILKMRLLNNIQQDKTKALIKWDNGTIEPYSSFNMISNKLNNFYGWTCNLGIDRVNIQTNGSIQGTCGERGIYGNTFFNINDKDFNIEFTPDVVKPIKCSMITCGCKTEIRINKHKTNV